MLRVVARLGEDRAVGGEHVQRAVARVLGPGAFEDLRHVRGPGLVADEGGDGQQVGVALVEGAAYPVGDGVGAVALVVDELLRYDGGVPGAVEQQHHRGGPDQQQDAAAGQQRAGADAPPAPLGAAGSGSLVRGRARAGRGSAEQLEPQLFQRVPDASRLAEPGHGHRPGEIAAGEAAALQEEPEQRALDRTEQQGHRERPDDDQRGGGQQAEQRVVHPAGVLRDGDLRDHGETEAGRVGALARLGRRERRVSGDRALFGDPGARHRPADAEEAAGARLLGRLRVLAGLLRGELREGLELLLGLLQLVLDALRFGVRGDLEAVAAEDRAVRVGHGDHPELAEADTGDLQAVRGDQKLLRLPLPRQQGEGEQPGLAVLQPHHPGGEPVLVGQLLPVDREERHVLTARGEQLAGLDLDDGRAAPLLVDAPELVEDGVGGDGIARVEQGRRPAEVRDRLVQRSPQRDGAVLGEVLLGDPDRLGERLVLRLAEAQGREAGQREQ
ncbi:hypothetical protein CU044_0620 [Streptomyces sp. L-9-10]|nr:hypothetical protein CU044_0620 [Streptomyces sp. L-9-10]